jgi:monoamine oxidase
LKSLDYRKAGFEPRMQTAIQQLGMGENCKISLLFRGKPWETLGYSGGFYSDLIVGTSWTAYDNEKSKKGFLVCMNGGEHARKLNGEPPHEKISGGVLASVLKDTQKIFGNISAHSLESGFLDNWPQDPWVKGSYSYYKTGGFSTFGGIESKKQGNVYFSGEHTAPYSMHGTMNGAVYSGVRVAKEIVADSSNAECLGQFLKGRTD